MKTIQDYLPTKFWLMKTEPSVFSFEDLLKKQAEFWDGVRNYQARNFMMQEMKVGHQVLFYHSNANPSGVVGVCEIVEAAKPDLSALDAQSPYFDEKATLTNPRWFGVTVGKPMPFKQVVSLADMRNNPSLSEMLLLRKGQRLSILPMAPREFNVVLEMGGVA